MKGLFPKRLELTKLSTFLWTFSHRRFTQSATQRLYLFTVRIMLFLSTFFHHHSTLISIPCLHVGNEFNKHLKRLNNCPLIPYFPSTILISISSFGNIYINRPESDWFKTLKTYPYFLLTSYHYFTVLSLVYESRVFFVTFFMKQIFLIESLISFMAEQIFVINISATVLMTPDSRGTQNKPAPICLILCDESCTWDIFQLLYLSRKSFTCEYIYHITNDQFSWFTRANNCSLG